jgi:hypothetical protein
MRTMLRPHWGVSGPCKGLPRAIRLGTDARLFVRQMLLLLPGRVQAAAELCGVHSGVSVMGKRRPFYLLLWLSFRAWD